MVNGNRGGKGWRISGVVRVDSTADPLEDFVRSAFGVDFAENATAAVVFQEWLGEAAVLTKALPDGFGVVVHPAASEQTFDELRFGDIESDDAIERFVAIG